MYVSKQVCMLTEQMGIGWAQHRVLQLKICIKSKEILE